MNGIEASQVTNEESQMEHATKVERRRARIRLKALYKSMSLTMKGLKQSKRDGIDQLLYEMHSKKAAVRNSKRKCSSEQKDLWLQRVAEEGTVMLDMHVHETALTITFLKEELRHLHLARAFLFGQEYKKIEPVASKHPNSELIVFFLKQYIPQLLGTLTVADVDAWLKS
jgi:cytosine/adenosine deaminase-related metal-dependent hydrolase